MNYQTDVVIVGAGVVGSSIARELSRYKLDIMLIEKQQDIGGYSSRANGATLAGNCISNVLLYDLFDKIPKDMMNVIRGARNLYPRLLDELKVKYERFGCITVAQTKEEEKLMDEGLRKAREMGDYGTLVLSILVDTFSQRISQTMPSTSKSHNIVCVLAWEEGRHWQSRFSDYSNS